MIYPDSNPTVTIESRRRSSQPMEMPADQATAPDSDDGRSSPVQGTGATVASPPRRGLVGWFGRPVFLEARSPFELRALRRSPYWRGEGIPAGEHRPVLVIPGFMASPTSADALVHVLRRAGWDAEIAKVGRNSGPAYTGLEQAGRDLFDMIDRHGRPVTIIGHSRGGQFGRILAVRHPELVRGVIAVGAPLLLKYPRFAPVRIPIEMLEISWRRGAFGPVFPDREAAVDRDRFQPFPTKVEFVSIYSRTDGIVDWRACVDPAADLIEVSASHTGLINSVPGIRAVARALTSR